ESNFRGDAPILTVDPKFLADYQELTAGAGLVDFSDRTLVELRGDDRHKFLHNLCTNEINKLPPNAGCEAFLTNVQGKILQHVLVFSQPESLVLETVADQAEKVITHLDRYLIREKVELMNRSLDFGEWLLAGAKAKAVLTAICGVAPEERLASIPATIDGHAVWLRRVELVGPNSYLIECPRDALQSIGETLLQ